MNDLTTSEHCRNIRNLADTLQILMRDGRELDLFRALSDIELEAKNAQWRLNDLRYRKNEANPHL